MSEPTPSQATCIRETFDIPSAVVAGAGSGKTDTLTRRIVYALEHPERSGVRDIDNILAITYTNKAAAELKSRIRAALSEAASPENGLALQALKVDGAWISTIHGMCSRILKENALAFGVDPAFAVVADERVEQLRTMALEVALAQMFDAPEHDDEQLLLCEYKREDIESMVEQLVKHMLDASGETDTVNFFVTAPVADPFECFMAFVTCTQKMIAVVDESEQTGIQMNQHDWNFRDAASAALARIFALPEGEAVDQAILSHERSAQLHALPLRELLALANEIPVPHGSGQLAKLELAQFDGVARTALVRAAAELRLSVGAQFLPALMRLAVGVVGTYTQLKNDAGVLDNNDLMSLVARAFLDPAHADIVQRYAHQFQLVMVDEFQDTNQMQVDMINLVAGGSARELSNKLCVVGDAQQSIYRFRNADLAVFQDHVRRVRNHEQGRVIELADNFRSHSDILSLVRGVFSRVFEGDFLDLHHRRDEARAQVAAPFWGAKAGEDAQLVRRVNVEVFGTARNKSISKRVAVQIACDFKQLCERGNRPGEMAILLGSMTHADVYAAALRNEGLKCAITGGSVFNKNVDVKIVEHLCAALANPHDSAALVAVLTSDLFCLEAGDLLQLVSLRADRSGALGDIFVALARDENARTHLPRRHRAAALLHSAGFEEASPQLLSAVEVLSAAYAQVGARPVSSLIESIFANSGWLVRLGSEGTARAANVFKAVRMVRDIEQSGAVGVRRLAEQVSAHINAAKEAPGVLTAQGDDFVRIMTIHASKGLSIPIVAVAETEMKSSSGDSLALFARGDRMFLAHNAQESMRGMQKSGVVHKAFGLLKTIDAPFADEAEAAAVLETSATGSAPCSALRFYEALRFLEEAGEIEEHQRKLYVAFTRAKEALIVTQKTIPDKQKARVTGGMHVNEALADLLTGDAKDASFTKAKTFEQQLITLPDLDEASEASSWELRLQVFPAEDEQKAASEGQSVQAKTEAAQTEGARSAEVPGAFSVAQRDDAHVEVQANAAHAGQTDAAVSTQPPIGAYPTTPLLLYEQDYPMRALTDECPYSPRWACGIVSASALAAAADEDGAGRSENAQLSDVSEGKQLLTSHAAAHGGASDFVQDALRADAAFATFPLVVGEDDEPPAPATERGSAFHALCEWAVRHRGCAGAAANTLPLPPQERIGAIAQFYGLNARQESELSVLLERWLASPQATAACAHRFLRPEAPFWVSLGEIAAPALSVSLPASSDFAAPTALDTPATPSAPTALDTPAAPPLMLEGFIDLLAYDTPGAGAAYVIDYKTGTRYNTSAKRRAAYELQAACYAYALMMQGFEELTLDFVFVDQLDFEHDNAPVVERFSESGAPPHTLARLREQILRSVQ